MIKYDLAIIGAGPAGLMAAYRAGALGAKVIILEKNKKPGVKLLLSGGGRCNFTNNISDPKLLAARYLPNGRFLISAFARFGPTETINFFKNAGVDSKEENDGRIFPASNQATHILEVLMRKIKEGNVEISTQIAVKSIVKKTNKIEKIILDNGAEIFARNYIIATGGKSYPATGSNGDAYAWLKKIGHNIIKPQPALTSILVSEKYIKTLEGLSLRNVFLSIFVANKKIITLSGDLIFTERGISGPLALDASRYLNLEDLKKTKLELDYLPDKSEAELNTYLQQKLHSGGKQIKNVLDSIIPPKLVPAIITLANIDPNKQANTVNKEEKLKLIKLLKKFTLSVSGTGDFSRAMITAGGIDLKEIDPKTMRSKLISNLYVVGELLDLTGPTGGFNLQLCWSTGYIAGEASVDKNIHS